MVKKMCVINCIRKIPKSDYYFQHVCPATGTAPATAEQIFITLMFVGPCIIVITEE